MLTLHLNIINTKDIQYKRYYFNIFDIFCGRPTFTALEWRKCIVTGLFEKRVI